MLRTILYLICLFVPISGITQSYKYTRYSEKDGLKNRFVYSVDQDDRGYLMIGTGEGLYSYDGFNFKEYTTANGLIHNFITCSNRSEDGAIWYGHDNGSISKFHNGKLDTINLTRYTHSRINQILTHDNSLWVLSQNDGILKRDPSNNWTQYKTGLEDFTLYSIYIDRFNRFWLGTDIGLIIATINDKSIDYEFVDEVSGSKVSCILSDKDQLIVGTEDLGIFIVDIKNEQPLISILNYEEEDFSSYHVNSLYRSEVGDLWICSNNKGLVQLSAFVGGVFRKKKEHSGSSFKAQSIKTCTTDREGNLWIGTIGDGLIKIQDSYLTLFSDKEDLTTKVHSIFEKNDTIWVGGHGIINICLENPDNIIGSIGKEQGLPQDDVTSVFCDSYGFLWVGTGENGLFKIGAGQKKLKKIELPNGTELLKVNDILIQKNIIYVATNYGVYQFLNEKLISHITIQSGLSVNSVKSLFMDMKGNTWLATSTSQITFIENGEIKNIDSGFNEALTQVRCLTEDNSGKIWIGTDGLGVICISGDTIMVVNKASGIYSDYCYSIVCDQRNNLWVGHHGAMSKINLLTGKIEVFDPSGQLDTDFTDNAAFRTNNGSILFGTNKGVLRYDPENDIRNEVEPVLRMEGIIINDSIVHFDNGIDLAYGKYNIRFDFIGISLKNSEGVKYQYYLEGYDNDWQALTSAGEAVYNKLAPGHYVFHVRCYNSDGYGGFSHLSVSVFVDKPFWQKWWFIGLCVLAALALFWFIIKRRERLLIENQIRLQNALDERTKEVVEQKELLEIKNKDITDSILYAKNIQQAMLPSTSQLSKYFTEAFVFFKPRDIVSGDFYWVEQYGEHIVVACADCTGHGVPGAFMSLIGSTLLKDVAGLSEVQSSADVLSFLDKELKEVLYKQDGALSVHDGMDIAVLDYNVKSKTIRIASANRPVMLYKDSEWIEIKGDRQTIGGDANMDKKIFTVHEYQINPGDTVYLFSDGITDQFGGPDGKKLKRSGLQNWLKSFISMPLNEQATIVDKNFTSWKGKGTQIDDVILLGVRF